MAHEPKWIDAKPDEPVTQVAARTLKSRLASVQQYLPLAAMRYQEDIEYVHQLRVCARRAEAALEMYGDLLPEWRAAWVARQLRRIRKATNEARDDDVFARRLSEDKAPGATRLLKRVRKHRVEAQKSVRNVHVLMTKKNGRFDRRVAKLLKRVRLRGKRRKQKEPTYRAWAKEHLRDILADFYDSAQSELNSTEQLHRFRIVGKKLRYAMELLSAAFDSDLRKNAYPLLETLQERLGIINDHASAIIRIEHWMTESEDGKRAVYLGELLTSEKHQLEEASRRFSAWWTAKRRGEMSAALDRALRQKAAQKST